VYATRGADLRGQLGRVQVRGQHQAPRQALRLHTAPSSGCHHLLAAGPALRQLSWQETHSVRPHSCLSEACLQCTPNEIPVLWVTNGCR
jgi:hypothetical protein